MIVCLSSAYLAPVEYYVALANADRVLIENCDYYMKQTYRNRCRMATANGVMDLSIPVEKVSGKKQLTRDVKISYYSDWQAQHWRSIESAYSSTPFFEYYKDDFIPLYEKKWTFLWDFNEVLRAKTLELLELSLSIEPTTEYKVDLGAEVRDLRERIHPKKESIVQHFTPYYQVFVQRFGFLSGLSIVDLLFNLGNESILYLKKFSV